MSWGDACIALHASQKRGREKGRGGGPEFELVRISVLREYLYREFEGADWSGVRDGYNLERVIDDFVFLW